MLVPDAAVLNAIGATEHRGRHEKSFILLRRDGTKMTGTTLGFVKEKDGLFLFLVEDKSTLVFTCFIPTHQIKDLQIGSLLGDTLVEKDLISSGTLAAALNTQAKLRRERIGDYLADRAIISVEELTCALREQATRPNVRLGDILIEEKLIAPEQLAEALTIQAAHRERRLGDILIEMGAVTMRLIQMALSDKLGIPYVNVRDFKLDPTMLEVIDATSAIRYQVLPLWRTGESLVVAVENPLVMEFAQDLRFTTGMTIVPVIADPLELKARIAKEYSSLQGRAAEGMVEWVPAGLGTPRGPPHKQRSRISRASWPEKHDSPCVETGMSQPTRECPKTLSSS